MKIEIMNGQERLSNRTKLLAAKSGYLWRRGSTGEHRRQIYATAGLTTFSVFNESCRPGRLSDSTQMTRRLLGSSRQ